MDTIVRRRPMDLFADLGEWFETGFPALPVWPHAAIRVENFMEDGKWIVRAELPGMDPDKDITVNVASGVLTISVERKEEVHERRHTEFRYGKLRRSLGLPVGADDKKITARYDNGILEVTVPMTKAAMEEGRHIPITRG